VGVAGLAAIQQAKNMNAVVTAFDVRAAAKEQVESMGFSPHKCAQTILSFSCVAKKKRRGERRESDT